MSDLRRVARGAAAARLSRRLCVLLLSTALLSLNGVAPAAAQTTPAAATPTPDPAVASPTPDPAAAGPTIDPASAAPTLDPAAVTPTADPAAATPTPDPGAAAPTVDPAAAAGAPAPAPSSVPVPAPAPSAPAPAAPSPAAPAPAVAPAPASVAPDEDKDVERGEEASDEGSSNIVHVENRVDNRFRLRGRVDVAHVEGLTASPVNHAEAFASCTDCQTFAVALQIALIRKDATTITPENVALAVNFRCLRCFTSARAMQYVFQVDDPDEVPERVSDMVETMNAELRGIQLTRGISIAEANARIDAVVAQFNDLAASLNEQRQDTDADNS